MKRFVFIVLLGALLLPPSVFAQLTDAVGEPVGLELNDGAIMELTVRSVEVASSVPGNTASGEFVILRIVTLNIGKVAAFFPITQLRIQDNAGREFEFVPWTSEQLTMEEYGRELSISDLRVAPGVSVEFVLIFDIPLGAADLRLSTGGPDIFSVALGIDSASPPILPTVDPVTPTAAFTVIDAELQASPRDHWSVQIEVADGSEGEQAYACAQAVFDYLAKATAPLVVVFGHSPGDLALGGFTVCRATGSLDGKGWTGNGESILDLPDDKRILVEMGHVLDVGFHPIYAFDVAELAARSESARPASPVPESATTTELGSI